MKHLVEIAETADGLNGRLSGSDLEWPVKELWAADGFVDNGAVEFDNGIVIVVLDLPPDEVTWLQRPPAAAFIEQQLRLGKRPIGWSYRPIAWPAWNHERRCVHRYWSAVDGVDQDAVENLRLGLVKPEEPDDSAVRRQLEIELSASRRYLTAVLDAYWAPEWRSLHKGIDAYPEHELWRAAQAVRLLEDTAASLAAATP